MSSPATSPPRVFISYSHKDETWKDRLVTQLKVLEYEGHFATWDDRGISAGDEWRSEIEEQLDQAAVAVLLISADFLTSDFIRGQEVPRLLQRRQSEGIRIVPVIVRSCAWKSVSWLAPIQARPRDGKPLAGLAEHQADEALATLAAEIGALVKATPASGVAEPRPAGRPSSPAPGPKRERITLLFLAAEPTDGGKINLDEEARDIQQKIRAADHRDAIDFQTRWAVRPDDLLQALNETRPTIVHFSGHGGKGQIYFKGDDGKARPVTREALKAVFGPFRNDVRLVMLNACFSDEQARALAGVVECAAGMASAIGDRAARVFAASFYRAVGFGHSLRNAFDQGVAALMIEGIPEERKPRLLTRAGVDADALYLLPEIRP